MAFDPRTKEERKLIPFWTLIVIAGCAALWVFGAKIYQESMAAYQSYAAITQNVAQNTYYPGVTVDGNDVFAVYDAVQEAVTRARAGEGPSLIECRTYRHFGHYNGDPAHYRPAEEVAEWMKKDPIPRLAKYMEENDIASAKEIEEIEEQVAREVEEAVAYAEVQPFAPPESTRYDVYTDIVEEGRNR